MSPHPLSNGLAESWAVEWGEDRFGAFTGFGVPDSEVVQRLRWIPPGRFLMGSPENETGRYDNEGPQHRVKITRGFWLGDTPVTQALWQAVMGNNPSEFKSPDRPVEQVSWDDCQVFLVRVNALVPGLDARLPTEAEWEYACRGGTTGATWAGELDLRGENNAPVLDAIAWYGGNSGQGFELDDGYDSIDWPERQYPHMRAGTRPVRGRRANPYGLYDMLGNVYQWCADWYDVYNATSTGSRMIDPCGPESGSSRVYRGGSWFSDARGVRAANRLADDPGDRNSHLGFRLARCQGKGPVRRAEPVWKGQSPDRG